MVLNSLHVDALYYAKPTDEHANGTFVLWIDFELEGSECTNKLAVEMPFNGGMTYDQIIEGGLVKAQEILTRSASISPGEWTAALAEDRKAFQFT